MEQINHIRRYVARRRARFKSCNGRQVNIPYGSILMAQDGFLLWRGEPLCATKSQNAHDFFVQDDDGCGAERGELVGKIISVLSRQDAAHDKRWMAVWADSLCSKYRRTDHEDFWIWSHDFFGAPIMDLRYIASLISTI